MVESVYDRASEGRASKDRMYSGFSLSLSRRVSHDRVSINQVECKIGCHNGGEWKIGCHKGGECI